MAKHGIFPYLQLTRPANVITAIADIWAGFAIAGAWDYMATNWIYGDQQFWQNLLWLSLSTIGLYAGGVAFNDIADAELDAIERPERPIPSGRASKSHAMIMSTLLLVFGIVCAFQVNHVAGFLASAVALCAVLYDYWGKHQRILGPINMGLCRSGNLLLGISVAPEVLQKIWPIALIPLIYVAAITMISRGEVHGKNRKALFAGGMMYASIFLAIFGMAYLESPGYLQVIPFLGLLGYMIFPPLAKAIRTQEPKFIGKSVKAAVISLIIVNASIAAAFSGWPIGIIVLLLLPISLWLAKKFAVT
ncbi:4-hydroxybenzoate polyprenyltransferase [Algoriphagus alkaliphilus]|uniref:4-hydroxybenzoate polyprenyltransferase n=1 Tax=Algoriphagus alkaliphilus TaxID=279824 RepID=A0A1G5ZMP9_9BACT|nr:UbiA-like protein EboC [Algoriphagus alkaliphilus]MBA4302025.1 polyprenyltransferase [Cyclobacterium sp.]SDA95902.1 4-hydroxybenzoate polyprenyltransferase [Algoriphagus alkaliphilus]